MRIKNLLSRFRQRLHTSQNKKGSSLGLVVIIGAALVIWVIGILPMMTASGTTAVDVQVSQEEYLSNRASIEFCKSELFDIVRDDAPYSFAVVDNGGKYSAIPRLDGGILNPAYQGCVAEDTAHPENDVPEGGEAGKNVTAICIVSPPNGNRYNIRIVTYHNGDKNMAYRATYTMAGTLKIYPEAYENYDALPLSDFVLVDGKLGDNAVWNATFSGKTVTEEHLLSKKIVTPFADYANAGEYPAVLKVTALPAKANADDDDLGGAIVEEPFVSESWILPYGPNDGRTGPGALTLRENNNSYDVYLDGQKLTAGTNYKLYYNGSETAPKNSGKYVITVDYNGSGAYQKAADAKNYLPVKGIVLGEKTIANGKVNIDGCRISESKMDNGKVKVTITAATVNPAVTSNTLTQYGYSTKSNPTFNDITWSNSNTFTLNQGTYYFFCYSKSGYMTSGNNRVFYPTEQIKFCGMVFPFAGVDKLVSGEQYMVVGSSGNSYYAMGHSNKTANNTLSSTNLTSMVQGTINNGVIAPSNDDLNAFAVSCLWTATGSNNTWGFFYNTVENEQTTAHYLNINGDIKQKTGSSWWETTYSYTYDGSLSISDKSQVNLSVAGNAAGFSLYSPYTEQFREGWRTVTKTFYGYPVPGNTWTVTGTESTSRITKNVYFVKLPTPVSMDNLYTPGYYVTHDLSQYEATAANSANILAQIKTAVGANAVYANGTTASAALNAGTYEIVAEKNGSHCLLGTLTVARNPQSELPALSVESLDYDVTLTGGAFTATEHGLRYYGYRITGETDYHWFNVNEGSFALRLPYNAENETYDFAVYECGTINVASGIREQTGVAVEPISFILPDSSNFTFTLSTDENGNTVPVWYKTLPSGVNEDGEHWQVTPSKITMLYGIVTDSGTTWYDNYREGVNRYGIYIRGSQYDGPNNLYENLAPVGITNVNGYQSSTLTASSIYLMGTTGKETVTNDRGQTQVKNVSGSLDTKGNDIYLTTDLLVLNDVINGGGHVYVYPYTPAVDGEISGTLIFFNKTFNNFIVPADSHGEFYLVPSGTDLNNVSATRAESMKCTWDTAVHYFRNGNFPEINLDIAYAESSQLDRIKSSETMGWTVDGNLKNSDTSYKDNAKYAVCTYVTSVTGSRELTANRILIAAKDEESGSYTLEIPANMTVTCRYFSVDAEYLIQGASGVKLTLKNLGQNSSYTDSAIQYIINVLSESFDLVKYNNKTLQMDYERPTSIEYAGGGSKPVKEHICRYEDKGNGVDIFVDEANEDLMVTYTIEELNSQFSSVSTAVQIVDRYIRLLSNNGTGELDVGAWFTSKLRLYTNYIYIDPSVKTLSLSTTLGSSDITINTQEMGYTAEEYLGIFSRNSAENYSGTILYVANPNGLKVHLEWTEWVLIFPVQKEKDFTLPYGFYNVHSSENGTSISALEGLTPLTAADLAEVSVYIKSDGSISNVYVDTGIYDNDNGIGSSGFSGGGLE